MRQPGHKPGQKGGHIMYTTVYYGGGLYRIFRDGQPIGLLDVRSIDWSKVTIVKNDKEACKNDDRRGNETDYRRNEA